MEADGKRILEYAITSLQTLIANVRFSNLHLFIHITNIHNSGIRQL
jgi:hypothetical protein